MLIICQDSFFFIETEQTERDKNLHEPNLNIL